MGIPTLIQEPNAFAGLANKWLGKRVDKVCVAFAGMGKFFPSSKIVITGNPVREQLMQQALALGKKADQVQQVLLMGGSGGAKSLNEAMAANTQSIGARPQVQWQWQCGSAYLADYEGSATAALPNVHLSAFIDRMDEAYAKADIVIGRAGSTTIAEIEYLGKPVILVPSPWVAEDHQTKNAEALTKENAAVLVADAEVKVRLVPEVFRLLDEPDRRKRLGENARRLGRPGAVAKIAEEVLGLISSPSPTPRHAVV
jgi:UDP-N-acetylglucosamine--N-acetylmuramyl-(pentapeptide) pyrophosphoryl-undecaprenol N-acetylglucosamine transferase